MVPALASLASPLFEASVGMQRKSTLFAGMHRIARAPGPASKFGAAVVGKRLVNLGLGVHHKRTVLRHGFANRAAL